MEAVGQTCKTCKHWQPRLNKADITYWPDLFGHCKKIQHPNALIEQTDWKKKGDFERWQRDEVRVMREQMAYVTDSSDYAAVLYTKPDFSCLLWELTTSENP